MLEPSIGLADNWANSTGLGWSRSLLLYYATIIVSVFDECVHVYIYIYMCIHLSITALFVQKGLAMWVAIVNVQRK